MSDINPDHSFYSMRAPQLPCTRAEPVWKPETGTKSATGATLGNAVHYAAYGGGFGGLLSESLYGTYCTNPHRKSERP